MEEKTFGLTNCQKAIKDLENLIMNIKLKLFSINLLVVIINLFFTTLIFNKNGSHEMTPVVVFIYVSIIFVMNTSYLLGLKNNKNFYLWPTLACFAPSIIFILISVLQLMIKPDEQIHIQITTYIINLILSALAFYSVINYQRERSNEI